MKYLKKIFESIEDIKEQYEIIEDFFLPILEDQDEDDPIFSEMDDADGNDTYCIFRAYYNGDSKIDTLEGYTNFISVQTQKINFLNKVNSALKRLTALGDNWEFEEDAPGGEVSVLVYYKKEGEETLELAFEPLLKGHRALHESILKRVLQKKYGLSLSSTNYTAGTSGYYGRNPYFALWFPKDTFDYEHQFYKDFMELRKKIKSISSVEVRENHDGTIFKIVL